MQLMNWKNNTLGRISIEIRCALFSGNGKSSPRKKKERKTSPHHQTFTPGYTLVSGLSPPCLTVYMMWVSVFVSERLSLSPMIISTRRCYVIRVGAQHLWDNTVEPAKLFRGEGFTF